ncbi:MAG TPA: hypothetical protein VFH27_09150 [Longimicrobiaceae bacterium]|nr:hypothetical protein [Longimicrobiaceae bacterium]
MPPCTEVARELDARHAEARAALEARDLARYAAVFSPTLAYRQKDGRVIGRDALMRDVDSQFRQLERIASSFVREELECGPQGATELLAQKGIAGITAFLVVHRTWTVTRRGRYTWAREDGVWRITAVEVLDEQVVGRFDVGLRAPPLPVPA